MKFCAQHNSAVTSLAIIRIARLEYGYAIHCVYLNALKVLSNVFNNVLFLPSGWDTLHYDY